MSRRQLPATPAPDDLSLEQQQRLVLWHCREWPRLFLMPNGMRDQAALKRYLRHETDKCLDYHRQHGNLWADWLATVRNWIRRDHDREGFSRREPPSSRPSTRGKRPFEGEDRMESMADVMPLFGRQEGKG